MKGKGEKKGMEMWQMHANAREPEELLSRVLTEFRFSRSQKITNASGAACLDGRVGRNLMSRGGPAPPTGAGAGLWAAFTCSARAGEEPRQTLPSAPGLASRHVGWSFSSGPQTGVTSWARRQLHSRSGSQFSQSPWLQRPVEAGRSWTRAGQKKAGPWFSRVRGGNAPSARRPPSGLLLQQQTQLLFIWR